MVFRQTGVGVKGAECHLQKIRLCISCCPGGTAPGDTVEVSPISRANAKHSVS